MKTRKQIVPLMRLVFTTLLTVLFSFHVFAQASHNTTDKIIVSRLMDSLWVHPESFIRYNSPNWMRLNEHLEKVDILQMNEIIHSIFYGQNSFLLNKSQAYDGFIGTLNKSANEKKLKKYSKKIRKGFRDYKLYPKHKVVLVEGDSWFEYPIFIKDITDHLEKNPNLAIYSHAHGADWIANIISSLQYEYDYIKVKPDVFIISGGGNDVVGDDRLSNFLRLSPISVNETQVSNFRKYVINRIKAENNNIVDTNFINRIVLGRRYLNKNFYRLSASLKIEYKMLFETLRKVDSLRFDSIMVITQGYDYPIPSYKKGFGVKMFMDNGKWLKDPLMMNGITDTLTQRGILEAIMFELNEMIIELGKEYKNVYHIDSRGFTSFYEKYKHKRPGSLWYNELHPKSVVFKAIADVYSNIIEGKTNNQKVVNVINNFKSNQLKTEQK
jgi:hypothetical protein